jgi:hypothetical protein
MMNHSQVGYRGTRAVLPLICRTRRHSTVREKACCRLRKSFFPLLQAVFGRLAYLRFSDRVKRNVKPILMIDCALNHCSAAEESTIATCGSKAIAFALRIELIKPEISASNSERRLAASLTLLERPISSRSAAFCDTSGRPI